MKLNLLIGAVLLIAVVAIGLDAVLPGFYGSERQQQTAGAVPAPADSSERSLSSTDRPSPSFSLADSSERSLSSMDRLPLSSNRATTDSLTPTDYSDPAAGGIVPLIMVEGLEDEFLSRHFRVEDFMARDGAPYARISLILVNTLEHIRWLADVPLHVNSGYRHPARNADPSVGGVARSQHLAGLAADIWSDEKTPGELAELALDVTGCDIGIGLGRTFIHIDLRGYTTSWVEEDAAMDEETFDAWVRARCAAWRANAGGVLPSFAEAVEAAAERAEAAAAAQDDALIGEYHDVMAAFAELQLRKQGPGAVVLHLSDVDDDGLPYQLSYVLPDSEAAQTLKLDVLIRSVRVDSYFAFAIIKPDGTTIIGATSYTPATG